jgi:hypothetical protein
VGKGKPGDTRLSRVEWSALGRGLRQVRPLGTRVCAHPSPQAARACGCCSAERRLRNCLARRNVALRGSMGSALTGYRRSTQPTQCLRRSNGGKGGKAVQQPFLLWGLSSHSSRYPRGHGLVTPADPSNFPKQLAQVQGRGAHERCLDTHFGHGAFKSVRRVAWSWSLPLRPSLPERGRSKTKGKQAAASIAARVSCRSCHPSQEETVGTQIIVCCRTVV